jgi:hypothetical protein
LSDPSTIILRRAFSCLYGLKWFSGGGFVMNFSSCGTGLEFLILAPVFACAKDGRRRH